MPPANHVILASGAAVAVSVAVATAIALYESPELRRYADDLRRRIAIALHSMGEGINPPDREPLYNRPEDAHGFLQSRNGEGAEPGVDADDETRRRQREELLYWNLVRLQKEQEKAAIDSTKTEKEDDASDEKLNEKRPLTGTRGSSFDDFLKQDANAEQGTYVFNTSADSADQAGLRRRGEGARGVAVSSSFLSNPFADEHFIGAEEIASAGSQSDIDRIAPSRDEMTSDIYSATTAEPQTPTNIDGPEPSLMELDDMPRRSESSATVDHELGPDDFVTAGQEDRADAYASIQAWAQNSQPDFYSPLPSTPAAPQSEPELLSDGQLTPTDSHSLAGSGVDVGNDALSSRDGEMGRPFDVISESDGMMTPASWSEVGSVISENDAPDPPIQLPA
jgi:hypothetical protein